MTKAARSQTEKAEAERLRGEAGDAASATDHNFFFFFLLFWAICLNMGEYAGMKSPNFHQEFVQLGLL